MIDFSTPSSSYAYEHIYSNTLLRTWFHRFDTLLSHFDFARLHSFLFLYLTNSRTDLFVSDTHHFLASHSVSSSLPRKAFSLMVASNCQLFCLSWSLTKLMQMQRRAILGELLRWLLRFLWKFWVLVIKLLKQ